jgi:hypothetical protein
MKIVKQHKNRSVHSEAFGIFSGKTLADIKVGINETGCTHGGTNDMIDYIKVGDTSHGAFLWFDDIQEAEILGRKLIEYAEEAESRLWKANEEARYGDCEDADAEARAQEERAEREKID